MQEQKGNFTELAAVPRTSQPSPSSPTHILALFLLGHLLPLLAEGRKSPNYLFSVAHVQVVIPTCASWHLIVLPNISVLLFVLHHSNELCSYS